MRMKDEPTPPVFPECVNQCSVLPVPPTALYASTKQGIFFPSLHTCRRITGAHLSAVSQDTWFPCSSSPPPPSLPPSRPASLMRTGPCVFDPAASSQPRGPSTSCLFNNPHRRSGCSPTALSTIWIQIKSTPVWDFFFFFYFKESLKGN